MKAFASLFFIFYVQQILAQVITYSIDTEKKRYFDEDRYSNKENLGFKIAFTSINNGEFFVFNRLGYDNKTATTMLYCAQYNLYITSNGRKLQYHTFMQAFPKGGFYKTNKTKLFRGKKVESYVLDNPVLKMQLWVADDIGANTNFINELKSLGILKNIPPNKKIVAFNIMGLEFEPDEIVSEKKETRRIKRLLEAFLIKNHAYDKYIQNCQTNTLSNNIKVPLTTTTLKTEATQTFIGQVIDKNDNKILLMDTGSTYVDTSNSITIYQNRNSESLYGSARINDVFFNGLMQKDSLYYQNVVTDFDCDTAFHYQLYKKEGNLYTYLFYNTEQFLIGKIVIDISYPTLKNKKYANGLVLEQYYINEDFEEIRIRKTIKKENHLFYLIKK